MKGETIRMEKKKVENRILLTVYKECDQFLTLIINFDD